MTNDGWVNEVAELRRRVEALEQRRVVEAERVDIVEADGNVRLVISNSACAPDRVCDGQTFKHDGAPSAGLFFYNDEGDECGGLVFGGRRANDGYAAAAALLFDQFSRTRSSASATAAVRRQNAGGNGRCRVARCRGTRPNSVRRGSLGGKRVSAASPGRRSGSLRGPRSGPFPWR